jgi:hypothetical protein
MMQVKALAVGSLILAASVAGSSDASASRAAIAITSTTSAKTLETTVVGRIDARTHKPVAALRLGAATFKVVVTNTGDVDLAGVTVDDPAVSTCSRTIGTLAAGK